MNHPAPAAAESPEEGSEKGPGGEGGGGEEASEHGAPGTASPPQPAAGAHQERRASRAQPGTPHPSPTAAQLESARHAAGGQEGQQTEVSVICGVALDEAGRYVGYCLYRYKTSPSNWYCPSTSTLYWKWGCVSSCRLTFIACEHLFIVSDILPVYKT